MAEKSLFICGKCGCDTRTNSRKIHKVVLFNRANMLCTFCKEELEIALDKLVEEYLSKP